MSKTSKLPLALNGEHTFGQRLRLLRKSHGFSQTELGEQIGVSKRVISSYECDQSEPPAHALPGLAQTLGVTTDYLLGLEALPPNDSAPRRRWMRRVAEIEKLPERKQRAILQVIDMALMD